MKSKNRPFAKTPKPPYYAVIFTSIKIDEDKGYAKMSEKMLDLLKVQEGFLGFESAREELGITVSYWKDKESVQKWKANTEHPYSLYPINNHYTQILHFLHYNHSHNQHF